MTAAAAPPGQLSRATDAPVNGRAVPRLLDDAPGSLAYDPEYAEYMRCRVRCPVLYVFSELRDEFAELDDLGYLVSLYGLYGIRSAVERTTYAPDSGWLGWCRRQAGSLTSTVIAP